MNPPVSYKCVSIATVAKLLPINPIEYPNTRQIRLFYVYDLFFYTNEAFFMPYGANTTRKLLGRQETESLSMLFVSAEL